MLITPKVIASKILFDHPLVRIVQDTLDWQDGRPRPYFYLASPWRAAATVGVTDEGQMLLIRQYRHPLGQFTYELPAGSLRRNEDPLEGARREFEEESGYRPGKMTLLTRYNQFPGSLRTTTYLFFASDLQPTQQHLDPGEYLELIPMPVSQVIQMIQDGEVVDGSLQLGVLMALQKGLLEPYL